MKIPYPAPLEVTSKWTSKRIVPQRRLGAIQRKLRDDLHDSKLCSPEHVLLSRTVACVGSFFVCLKLEDFVCKTELN